MALPGFPVGGPGTNNVGWECPPIQLNLSNYLCGVAPANKRDPLALIGRRGLFRTDYLRGAQDLAPRIISTNGPMRKEVHTVELKWLQRDAGAVLDCSTVDPCGAGPGLEDYQTETKNISMACASAQISFSKTDWERACTPGSIDENIMNQIARKLNKINVSIETQLLAKLIAAVGANVAPANPAAVGAFATLSAELINEKGMLNANALHLFLENFIYNDATDCTPVFLHGYRNPLQKLSTILNIGCCNDDGVDQRRAAQIINENEYARFRSFAVDTAMTAAGQDPLTDSLFIHPGSAHFVEYLRYDTLAFNDGESFGRVFTDPISGERYDMKVNFTCDENYTLTLSKQADVLTMPTDLYAAGDRLAGVNGIFGMTINECTPENCPPAP